MLRAYVVFKNRAFYRGLAHALLYLSRPGRREKTCTLLTSVGAEHICSRASRSFSRFGRVDTFILLDIIPDTMKLKHAYTDPNPNPCLTPTLALTPTPTLTLTPTPTLTLTPTPTLALTPPLTPTLTLTPTPTLALTPPLTLTPTPTLTQP